MCFHLGVGPIAITAITGFGAVSNGPSKSYSSSLLLQNFSTSKTDLFDLLGQTPYVTGNIFGPDTTGPSNVASAVLSAYNAANGMKASYDGLPSSYLDTIGVLSTPGVCVFFNFNSSAK